MSVRRFLLLAPVTVTALLLQSYFWVPSQGEGARTNPERAQEYLAASLGDASLLNPILHADAASGEITGLVFEGLLDRDRDLGLRGRVAKSWELGEVAYVRVDAPSGARDLATRLGKELASWPSVTSVDLIEEPPRNVDVDGREGRLTVRVAPVPAVRISLDRVEPQLFSRLEPLLGEGYFRGFRPERYCSFPEGVRAEERERLSREVLPATVENPILLFRLREGVTFHDGRPVTSRDVAFTYRAIMDPRNISPRTSDFEPVLRVETPDPLTVRVVYKYLYSPAVATWQMGILPEHLLNAEALTEEARGRGRDPAGFTLRQSSFNRRPVGCGPFRFERWLSDRHISLRRFESYWEGAPNFHRYVMRVIPDVLMQQMEFLAGTLDAYQVQPYQVSRFREDPRYQVFSGLALGYTFIGYNLRRPPFDDVRVRRALGMALDVDALIRYALDGEGERTTGPYPKQTDYYDPGVEPLPHDPEEALRLLSEAGWRRDALGRLSKDGVPLHFTLITNNGNDSRKAVLAVAQEAWKRLGIEVRTDVLEWSVFVNERIDKHDFDAVVLGWSMGVDPDLYQLWHSSQTDPFELNFVGFRNPSADALIADIRKEYDPRRQAELCHELHRVIAAEQPYTFLFAAKWTAALDREIVVREADAQGRVEYRPIRPTKTGSYTFDLNRWVRRSPSARLSPE